MGMCPLCNGFSQLHATCQNCGSRLVNQGREAEYYDDYSPYMPIDEMKLVDGYLLDAQNHECPHLFKCQSCGTETTIMIQE